MSEERLDGETMSLSKRIKEMSIDRLSALPDSLLIHILSLLGVKGAAATSVLSKRWQFLWSELPRLVLRESSWKAEKIDEFVAMVNRALLIRSENYLEEFEVNFNYDKSLASNVNVWVEFAVKNKVKEVSLMLDGYDDDFYVLPQMMYSSSSLTRLGVRGCSMDPRRPIEWRSLTGLFLEEMELRQHVIENILSGCPVLHSLHLRECRGFNCLEASNRSLYKLEVHDCDDGASERLLEISAPHVNALEIWCYPMGGKLRLTNIPSDVRAAIHFIDSSWDSEVISNTKELLESIRHVEQLTLGCNFVEVVSVLSRKVAREGWQLPQSRRRFLTVNASSDEHNIDGILGLLESSPDLETFIINGCDPSEASWAVDVVKGDLDCDLLHLKSINIKNFVDPDLEDLVGEPLLKLARILLKSATVLEQMVVEIEEFTKSQSKLASSDPYKIAKTLLSYPRSSQKAVVLLR